MANNPVVNSITFAGGVAGQASVQAQGIAGNLTFLLPNTTPITGQLLDVQAVNGNNVFLGWVSAGTETISLSQLLQSGATTNQFISWNGTSWVPTSSVPGEGTVTSVAVTVPAWLAVSGSPITSAGTIAITSAPSLTANWVLATPDGSAGVLTPRALVAADIPSLPYLPTSTQLPVTKAFTASQWLDSYTSSSGVFTSSQPNFTDLAGSIATGQILASTITIAQINSKVGNGNAVQLSNTGQTINAGDVLTYDVNGNVQDSGTLLSSLATNASVALKANIASPTFTGVPAAPTATPLTNSTQIATTAYADAAVAVETGRATTAEGLLAPLASPTFTGTVTLPATVNGTAATDLTIAASSGQSVLVNAPLNIELTAIAGHVNAAAAAGISLSDTSSTGISIAEAGTGPLKIKQTGTSGNLDLGTLNGSVVLEANAGAISVEASTTLSLTSTASNISMSSVTGTSVANSTSGDIALTQNGSGNITATTSGTSNVQIHTATGVFEFFGTGGGMSLTTQNADITIDASGNISLDPASAQTTTLSGIVAVSGTSSFTTANPTFFSSQGNGSKVQLSTGGFTNGDVVTQDANGNTIDSGTLLSSLASTTSVTAKPNLYDGTGADPAAGDNHIASGSATLAGTTGVTVTLTGSAVFADTNYVVQVTRTQVTAHTGASVYVTVTDGANFTIFSDAAGDTGTTVAWTAIGF